MVLCCAPCGSCGEKASESDVFKSKSERSCTDVIFILLLIVATGGSIAISVVSITANPGLIDDLRFPPDSYGNNCGRGSMSDNPKAMYPSLDADISNQWSTVASGRWWNFKPTVLCTNECPNGLDLTNPRRYGGPDYPCNGGRWGGTAPNNCTSPPWTYYMYYTEDVIGRCMPLTSAAEAAPRDLCVVPSCTSSTATDLNVSLTAQGFYDTITCASVESQPGAQAWELCPAASGCGEGTSCCTEQKSACSGGGTLKVHERVTATFQPTGMTSESQAKTELFASYVKTVLGGYEGLVVPEGITALTVFGIGLPIILCFAWAMALWMFAGIVVYAMIILLVVSMLMLTSWLMIKAGWFNVHSSVDSVYNVSSLVGEAGDTEKTWFTVFSFISVVITVMFVLFIVIYRKCIKRLVAILEECTKVFKSMIAIVFWPLGNLFLQLVIAFYWFFSVYFGLNAPTSLFSESWHTGVVVVFQCFIAFWLSQFVQATFWTSMSAAISNWFVTTNAPGAERTCCGMGIGVLELASSTCLVLSKHIGSMAFGSLIIAICQTVRAVVVAIDQYTQDLQNQFFLLRLALKCLQYCLACIQRTIEFISYYGFVFVAMRGESFCRACGSTFEFVMKYAAQTAVNKTVVSLLTLLIGVSTPVLCATVAFYYLEAADDGQYAATYNTFWAALVVFIVAYIVTSGITMVYNCAIDTIYLCAMKDMEENSPPKFMSNDLRNGFGIDEAENEATKAALNHKSVTQRRRGENKERSGTYSSATASPGATSALGREQSGKL